MSQIYIRLQNKFGISLEVKMFQGINYIATYVPECVQRERIVV